jgi:hypothetical protein
MKNTHQTIKSLKFEEKWKNKKVTMFGYKYHTKKKKRISLNVATSKKNINQNQ